MYIYCKIVDYLIFNDEVPRGYIWALGMTLYYMNHVIYHIETPPGLTPPRLLPGGRGLGESIIPSPNLPTHM